MSESLLPCPFCGAPASGYEIEPHTHALSFDGFRMPDHPGSYVIEGDCACGSGLIGETCEEVTARWNTRATHEGAAAEPVAWMDGSGDTISATRKKLWLEQDGGYRIKAEKFTQALYLAALTSAPAVPEADALRAEGWSVAVHNDYKLQGVPYTFWLFTKDGRAIKGEGQSDAEALSQVRAAIKGVQPGERGEG